MSVELPELPRLPRLPRLPKLPKIVIPLPLDWPPRLPSIPEMSPADRLAIEAELYRQNLELEYRVWVACVATLFAVAVACSIGTVVWWWLLPV